MKLKKFKERDNKRIGIIVFTLVCILLVSGVILYRTFAIFEVKTNQNVIKGTVQGMGDVEFAFYINNSIVKSAPKANEKENYVFDEESSNCTNGASVYWDYQVWGPTVSNITETKTKCYLKFKTEYSESILNGAVPKLKDELTPVTIDDNGTVRKADVTQRWYNYGSQQWANAVITGNSYELLGSNIHGDPEKGQDYIHLDGVNDYIDLGLEGYEFTNGITLAIKFKLNKIGTTQAIIGNWNLAGGGIYVKPDGGLEANFYINGQYFNANSNEKIVLGEYNTVIATYDNNIIKLYLNGMPQNIEASVSGNIAPCQEPILIGADPDGGGTYIVNYADMDVKQATVFHRTIDEDEIQAISNNFKITNGNGLLKYVDFTNKTYEAGEVISEDNIESYFVWIPRYKYQIWNGEEETSQFTDVINLGSIDNTTTKPELNKQKEIKIEFENKHMPVSDGNLKNQWLTHPAFTSFESNGFWTGKFETGYKGATQTTDAEQNIQDTSKVIIKPNVYSWRDIQIANAFGTSKDYKTNLDSHMMKNMEWGAVAYLTNSKYGRCPNGKCSEVRINNNSNYITGSSAVNAPTCGYLGSNDGINTPCNKYGTNEDIVINYDNPNSRHSSTTDNYYGIYDMSGGAWEYVMGVMLDENRNLRFEQMGFNSVPEVKYYDLYDYDETGQTYYRGKLGDGTKEFGPFYLIDYSGTPRRVSEWNSSDAFFVNNNNPCFLRGGLFTYGTVAGPAAFNSDNGRTYDIFTFRIVLTP